VRDVGQGHDGFGTEFLSLAGCSVYIVHGQVGQVFSKLVVVSRAGVWSCCSLVARASYCHASMAHLSLSTAASTPRQWRRKGYLHEKKSIWQEPYDP
jgi:hypothetical protein